jgi:hypothetical protein
MFYVYGQCLGCTPFDMESPHHPPVEDDTKILYLNDFQASPDQSNKLSFLVSGPLGTQVHIFVFPRLLFYFFILGLLFDERRGLTTMCHSLFIGEWFC